MASVAYDLAIVMTGLVLNSAPIFAATGTLSKPISPETLLVAVREALRHESQPRSASVCCLT
jgi:hypothetical protein